MNAQRLKWLGPVHRMDNESQQLKNVYSEILLAINEEEDQKWGINGL